MHMMQEFGVAVTNYRENRTIERHGTNWIHKDFTFAETREDYFSDISLLHIKLADMYNTFVHPDSLHIFKPQEGDLVEVCDDNGFHVIGCFLYDKRVASFDCTFEQGEMSFKRIIDRNNKHFFMPEEVTE